MAPKEMSAVLRSRNQLSYCVCFITVKRSYNHEALLDIRTAITYPVLEEHFFFNESDRKDLLQMPDKAPIPIIRRRKRRRYRDEGLGAL